MLGPDLPDKVALATFMGYASICCWVCAQLPQVIKNYNLKSVEGLALPFLINWLSGDITNFIGCVLTDQLPFQKYLAAYFCVIDFTLVYQYYLYRRAPPIHHAHHPQYSSNPMSPSQIVTLPPADHRARSSSSTALLSGVSPASTVRPSARGLRSNSAYGYQSVTLSSPTIDGLPHTGAGNGTSHLLHSPMTGTDSYQDLYEAALDVARAAERVSERRSQSRRRLSRQNTEVRRARAADLSEEDERSSGDGLAGRRMMDSFHSDMSALTSSTGTGTVEDDHRYRHHEQHQNQNQYHYHQQRHMSHSTAQAQGSGMASGGLLDGRGRTRTLARFTDSQGETPPESDDQIEGLPGEDGAQRPFPPIRSKSRSLSLARGSSGRGRARRAAGVALMSLGILGGWGRHPLTARGEVGRVLVDMKPANTYGPSSPLVRHPQSQLIPPHSKRSTSGSTVEIPVRSSDLDSRDPSHDHDHDHDHRLPPHGDMPKMSWQHVIGRVSAWACTTLYLTSRLPQIWKNFERKSVEGLSILLFFFAFCGNITYVFSILLNPAGSGDPSESTYYLLEALPYLLGSGGTVMFDLTIMLQSLIYGSAPPIDPHPHSHLHLHSAPISARRRPWRRKKERERLHPEDGVVQSYVNGSLGIDNVAPGSGPGSGSGAGPGMGRAPSSSHGHGHGHGKRVLSPRNGYSPVYGTGDSEGASAGADASASAGERQALLSDVTIRPRASSRAGGRGNTPQTAIKLTFGEQSREA